MIETYSFGYQRQQFATLEQEMIAKEIDLLIDVRSKPYGRAYAFNKKKLEALYGIRYTWKGETLGGFAEIKEADVEQLAELCKQKTVLLMCFEENPAECHRHYELAKRLAAYGVTVNHLYRGEVYEHTKIKQATT